MIPPSLSRALPFVACLLTACATPRSVMPAPADSELEARRLDVQRQVVDDALAREDRVHRLSWPLITANAPLCRKTGPRLGWRPGDADAVRNLAEGLNAKQVEALGWDDSIRILSVAPGSPAALAGLEAGMRVIGIDDTDVETMGDLSDAFGDRWKEQEDDFDPVTIRAVGADGSEASFDVKPVRTCDIRIVSAPSNEVNASASFSSMEINAGLLRAVPDDNTVAFVIAHELAHWSEAHPRKGVQNASLTGAILWGPVLMISGGLADIVAAPIAEGFGREAPPFSTVATQAMSSSIGIADFEREADYVGAYMLARAGGDPAAVGDIFQLFSNIRPLASWVQLSHPTGPERQLRLTATAEEIAEKKAAGAPLVPNGWAERQPQ